MGRTVVETGFLGPSPPRKIVRISITAPLRWIKRGIGDFLRAPLLSLFYGTVFAGVCYGGFKLFLPAPGANLGYLASLFFWAPFLAAGLYAAGRDLEFGRVPNVVTSIRPVWTRKAYLALFSLMLTALILGWVRLSTRLLVVYLDAPVISAETIQNLLASPNDLIAVGSFTVVTLAIATLVFFVSAIALPLVFDGDAEFINAMITSYLAAIRNPVAMLFWAGLVVILLIIGIAVWFIGLAIVFPILGYATWHSYRDLVK